MTHYLIHIFQQHDTDAFEMKDRNHLQNYTLLKLAYLYKFCKYQDAVFLCITQEWIRKIFLNGNYTIWGQKKISHVYFLK